MNEILDKTKIPNFYNDHEIPVDFVGKCFVITTNAYGWVKNKGHLSFHREDGPAIIWVDEKNNILGYSWVVEGKGHRIGGPSYQYSSSIRYHINDEEHSEDEYWNHPLVLEWKLKQIIML